MSSPGVGQAQGKSATQSSTAAIGPKQSATDQIRSLIIDTIKTLQVPRVVYGIVTATSSTTPTCSIELQGTSTVIAGVKYTDKYAPVTGDTVVAARVGTDLWITDRIATVSQEWITVGAGGGPSFGSGWAGATTNGQASLRFRRVGDLLHINGAATSSGSPVAQVFAWPLGYVPLFATFSAQYLGGSLNVAAVTGAGFSMPSAGVTGDTFIDMIAPLS